MKVSMLWIAAILSGCASVSASNKITPQEPRHRSEPQELAVSEQGFCQIMGDQTLRCRETQREQPSYAETPPSGKFQNIVAYHRGFCALDLNQEIMCWRNINSTFYDSVEFKGKFKAVASDYLQVCALDLEGALWCARPASDTLSKERVASPALRISEGPYMTLFSGSGVCALAESHADCLWPTFPYSHQPRKPGEFTQPDTKYMQRLDGEYSIALRTKESTCGLRLDGRVTCEHASRYPNPPKQLEFAGEFTELVAGPSFCAKRKENTWVCEERVEKPDSEMSKLRVFMNMRSDRAAGLTPHGEFVGRNAPPNLRGGFKALYGHHSACAVREDRTVFCEWPSYDDDAFLDVSTIEASETEWFTDKGKFSISTEPRFKVMRIHGQIDPRNQDVKGYTEVQHGRDFGCGLKENGDFKCWLTTEWNKERARPPVKKFKSFALGQIFGCGITPDDDVKCWGNDYFGAVTNQPEGKFTEIRTTRLNSCAVRADNEIVCWGQAFPEPFVLGFKPEQWALTGEGICAIDQDRNVQCFGLGYAWTGSGQIQTTQ